MGYLGFMDEGLGLEALCLFFDVGGLAVWNSWILGVCAV